MGFYKKLLMEKEILKQDEYCRKCGSTNLNFTKHIGFGGKMGVVYHYKAHCASCRTTYHVKRTRAVFAKVKDQQWIKSKSYIEHEYKQKLL